MKICKFIALVCFSLLSIFDTQAQLLLQSKVIDSESGKAIPYVNIGIPSLALGTVSDLKGNFEWQKSDEQDSIVFSSIGYEAKKLTVKQVEALKTVSLNPVEYELEEVNISATRFADEEVLLGAKNKKRGISLGFGSSQLGTEVGSKISIDQPFFVKSAHFVLNHAKGDSMVFRVNIYQIDEDNNVGQQLLKEQIIIRKKQKKGTIDLDMEPYNIILEEDILLCLEWVEDDGGRGNLGLSFDLKKGKKDAGIYYKSTSHSGFFNSKQIKKYKPCFYLMGKMAVE